MIIACPECSKKFQVPDNAIPKAGRTVQCSSCSNEWKQYPLKKPKVVQLKESSPIVTRSVTKVKKFKKAAVGQFLTQRNIWNKNGALQSKIMQNKKVF